MAINTQQTSSGNFVSIYVLVLLLMAGCTSQVAKDPLAVETSVAESLQRYSKEYVLAPGDLLDVVIYRNPELSRQSLIRSDGFISLPVLDDVRAAGLTIRALDDYLTEQLNERLVDPEVTIIITNAREPMVYVVGEVQRASAVPLREARTAAEAIARSGAQIRSADLRQVSIIRLDGSGFLRAYTVETHEGSQAAVYMALQNVSLLADDLIFVPESDRSQAVRNIQDFISTPMGALNQILTPYFQVRLIEEVSRNR